MGIKGTPLISVIVRSMERPSLVATLASIAKQTHPNIEVIVVNAKGAGHVDIAAQCAPFVGRLLNVGGQPLGRSQAANLGLDALNGDYFAFLDDDDTIDPSHFEALLAFAGQQSENTVVYAGIRAMNPSSPEAGVLNVYAETFEEGKLLSGNFIPIHAPLVPCNLLERGPRFDERLEIYEDWDFWLQVSQHAKLIYSGTVSGTYAINGTSGANPETVSQDTMRGATLILYRKWLPLLAPTDIWKITRLYHQRNLRLHQVSLELAALGDTLRTERELNQRQTHDHSTALTIIQSALTQAEQELLLTRQQYEQLRNVHELMQRQLAEAGQMLALIYRSRSWALTAPLRQVSQTWRSLCEIAQARQVRLKEYLGLMRFVHHAAKHNGGLGRTLRKAVGIYRQEGWTGITRRLPLRRLAVYRAGGYRHERFPVIDQLAGQLGAVVAPGSIAVMVHAYYPELFEEMVPLLNKLPWGFDLYVSVTTQAAREVVEAQTTRLSRVAEVSVRIVPNRGRDIAPLLVEFREALRRHDFVLHLHTKKSLYSGRERQEWRTYLLEGLIGSEQRIRHVFEMFARNAQLGIVYPETFEGVPYWAHSWLKNRGIAQSLANRLDIDIEHKAYVDAPMGSMFWARSAALEPLFALGLDYKDFPEEQGQTDGTLQHTLERFFVLAANRAGYSQRVMLDAEEGGSLFLAPGGKNLHHYFFADLQQKIQAASASAEIVSFDIFDTLLIRPWIAPANLFAYMEEVLLRSHGLENFAQLRREAEQLARMELVSGDVGIEAIYRAFATLCGDVDLAISIRFMEESLESQQLMPRPDVCNAALRLREKGKRIVLVSDMYLSRKFLESLLREKQLALHDALYVSNDIGVRKDRGDMWPAICKLENVAKERWQHVGDNEHADLQLPIEAGYPHPVHLMRSSDLFLLFNEDAEDWLRPQCWQEGLYLGLLANRFYVSGLAHTPVKVDARDCSITLASLRDFGYAVFGPALCAFMSWLVREAQQDGVTKLLYASREGHLLKQAHDLIAAYASIPDAAYFLCSRRAAVFASIIDLASLQTMLTAHFNGSFGDFLNMRLGLEDTSAYRARIGNAAFDKVTELPEDTEAFRSYLQTCSDLLEQAAEREREAYQIYADQTIADNKVALVDIGYSGTIQKALNRFVGNLDGGYYFVTVEKAGELNQNAKFAKGCFGDLINAFHSDIPLYQYSLLSEAILTAPHGQLLRFEIENGTPTPRFKSGGLAQAHFADIDQIHQGSLCFLEDVLKTCGENFTLLAGYNHTANLAIRQVMENRWKTGFETPALHVEDNYSGNHEISVFAFYEEKRKRLPGTTS